MSETLPEGAARPAVTEVTPIVNETLAPEFGLALDQPVYPWLRRRGLGIHVSNRDDRPWRDDFRPTRLQ